MSNSIVKKIEEILEDDRNFSTRTGLRFTLEVVRDAFNFIDTEKEARAQNTQRLTGIEDRVEDIETKLNAFLNARKTEQDDAKDERKFYRRAVIGGIISILLMQISLYFTR